MIIVKIGLFEFGFYAILSKKSYAETKVKLFSPKDPLLLCAPPNV